MKKHFKIIALGLLALPAAIATLWATGALAYDGPGPVVAITATVLLIGFMVWRKFNRQAWVFFYRTTLTPAQARTRFLEYIESINALAEKPRWYHAITTNCTTAIRTQNQSGDRLPLDWRILVNGRGDEMMFEHGMLDPRSLNFPVLRKRSHANAAIQAAGNAPDFSARIRSILQF